MVRCGVGVVAVPSFGLLRQMLAINRRLMWPTSTPRVATPRLCHMPSGSVQQFPSLQHIDDAELPGKWVLFTDLHVQRSTLPICVQVLRKVASEARKRQAGVICLGDFWHAGGVLQTRALNRILTEIQEWGEDMPMLMIPGNHDQSMRGDPSPLLHALTPLRLSGQSNVRVFSRPTLLGDSLWVPYGTSAEALRNACKSAEEAAGGQPLSAVFCHADVVGGLMNEGVANSQGLPPTAFPPLPTRIYSGHYHKPHVVPEPAARYACVPPKSSSHAASLGSASQRTERFLSIRAYSSRDLAPLLPRFPSLSSAAPVGATFATQARLTRRRWPRPARRRLS